ncbi:MAG: radical SAM family heme chaperone HemW [Magnetococcales bacterium]|nr:radical SAM family heme chaperone HemW [Magnetococcales bacterium]
MTETVATPLTLYIHLPFCIRKCPYCDFHSLPDRLDEASAYVARLIDELRHRRSRLVRDARPLHAIFFGGGTPSLMQSGAILTILDAVRTEWPLEEHCEITLEANPESCHLEKIGAWMEAGVNRVSLGVQALDDHRLRQLGRPHDRDRALRAIDALKASGLTRINMDLIYATPGLSLKAWEVELTEAVALALGHLSCYALTLEEGTPFKRLYDAGRLRLPDEGLGLAFFRFTRQFLAHHGYDPYEISNFAKPGQTCRHNLNYWEYGDYLGIGSGAHGKWQDGAGMIWRWANRTDLTGYLCDDFVGLEPLQASEAAMECVMMGLRKAAGMSRGRYRSITGLDLVDARSEQVMALVEAGLVVVELDRVRVTEMGAACLDDIVERLTG